MDYFSNHASRSAQRVNIIGGESMLKITRDKLKTTPQGPLKITTTPKGYVNKSNLTRRIENG
jgi:hypothetical protein